uniref:Prolyl endopeptidase n=1 Tax=Angiostrongylus cantonensis TaxID=6313 RepID=A0A0K0D742_ANGCA
LWDYEKYSCTSKRGDFYYYSYNSGLQNQSWIVLTKNLISPSFTVSVFSVIYQQKTLSDKGDIFLDPNTPDGTTSIRISEWTSDGSILAYGLSERGSDWVTVKFRRADKKDLSDVVEGVKHSSLSWLKDNSGLFYCKYPEHKTLHEGTSVEKHKYHSLYFHRMGTHCMEDVLIYDRRDNADYMIGGTVTEDGRFLIIDVSRGCDMYNMLYYYDLSNFNGSIGKIYVDHDDNSMLIYTNYIAPMFKLIRVALNDGSTKEVVPENPHSMLYWAVPVAGDRLVLCYIEDVKSTLYVHNLNSGTLLYPIPLKIGSVSGFFGRKTLHEVFFSYESFTVPTIVYHVDFASVDEKSAPKVKVCTGAMELRRVNVKGMDEDQFSVEQVFFESKDKTKVPMYILSLKDVSRDGTTPTILNGYGGFNVSDMPYFSISRLFFVRHFGGVIACANLRGGSEYGENWHMSGMRENKQNVFDDFISAAEYLISHEYTCSKK